MLQLDAYCARLLGRLQRSCEKEPNVTGNLQAMWADGQGEGVEAHALRQRQMEKYQR